VEGVQDLFNGSRYPIVSSIIDANIRLYNPITPSHLIES